MSISACSGSELTAYPRVLQTAILLVRQYGRSTLSVPVAATAISLSFGSCDSVFACKATLLQIAMEASRSRSTTWFSSVSPYSTHSCAKLGLRNGMLKVFRSRKTIDSDISFTRLVRIHLFVTIRPPRCRPEHLLIHLTP